jgi:hypothetical protein
MTTPRPKPRPRRFLQFSLRALLVFVLLVSVGMSWFAVKLEKARRQRQAVEVIGKAEVIGTAGGGILHEYEWPDTSAHPPDPEWVRTFLGDDFLFDVVWVSVVEDFGDDDVRHLKVLTNLVRLDLSGTQVTDAGLEHLERLTNLTDLYLSGTQVTDAGLGHLRGLTNLEYLYLRDTQVTDAGLEHLKELTKLTKLDLRDTQVTDAGLEHLEGLTKLELLALDGTQVTSEGVKKLQEALPDCAIQFLGE